jgi:hypothetical protein
MHVEKGQTKQGKIYVIMMVFTSLCCFAAIEMKKGNRKRGRLRGCWGATFPKWKV